MKKRFAIIMVCILIIMSSVCVSASADGFNSQEGFAIEFNGEATGYVSIICNNTHYVPLRAVFEKMGASVFYRSSDHQIMALSRNGDTIYHIVGDNAVTINGNKTLFKNPSVLDGGVVYIPLDMIASVFCPDSILCENQQLNIQKNIVSNEYNRIIKDVLDVCRNSDFDPARFQRYINYHIKMPALSMQSVIFNVNIELDSPFYENVTTIEYPNELLVLVNKHHKLPAGFNQYNLVNMNRAYTVNDGKKYLLADVAYEKFVQMSDAARKEGLSLKAISAYRTEDYQRNLYNNKLRATGKTNADNYSARPGYSEHQTGLAVDINTTRESFENTYEFRWLQNHAYEYGFIMRYPKGKEWITGYSYEPWHYRYVGTETAREIYQEGVTYEEYYAKYISSSKFR